MCLQAGTLFNGHLVLFSEYLYACSTRKKIHFITRNKNIMERAQVAGDWLTSKTSGIRCQTRVLCFQMAASGCRCTHGACCAVGNYSEVTKNQIPLHSHPPNNSGIACLFSDLLKVLLHSHNKRKKIQIATVTPYSSEGLILEFYRIKCFSGSLPFLVRNRTLT